MMKTLTSIATLLLAITLGAAVHAEDKDRELSDRFTKPITFKFVDEAGEPIKGTFTLHHTKNGKYVENWHRYKPLNEQGEITIAEFPPEFEFGGTSNDDCYLYWIRSSELDPAKTKYLRRCSPSGAMKFEITKFPKKYYASLVVEYHRKLNDGSHEFAKGIGIGPDDPQHTIGGLESGEYFIAIKFHYEDEKPIFKSEPFSIKVKEYAALPKIEITEAMIEASKR
jgi:hypothetical protein